MPGFGTSDEIQDLKAENAKESVDRIAELVAENKIAGAQIDGLSKDIAELEVENRKLREGVRSTFSDLMKAHYHSRADLIHEASFDALQRLQAFMDDAGFSDE